MCQIRLFPRGKVAVRMGFVLHWCGCASRPKVHTLGGALTGVTSLLGVKILPGRWRDALPGPRLRAPTLGDEAAPTQGDEIEQRCQIARPELGAVQAEPEPLACDACVL